jgi:hypothetical protein
MSSDQARTHPNHAGPNMLVSFAPWLSIWILGGHNTYRIAAVVGLIASVVIVAWELFGSSKPKLLDWGTLVVFIVLCILAYTTSNGWLAKWLQPVANGALFAIMAGSIVAGHPFAESYGRDSAPPETWSTPVFRRIVLGISVIWAVALLAIFVGSLISAFYPSTTTWSTWVVTVAALVLALRFQHRFPNWVRNNPTTTLRALFLARART